ncbi:MAG: hypothetical protein OXK21_01870 [Chloroflexota bacterium]|nr:hypothetical protein [Chloroflexota bacterium]
MGKDQMEKVHARPRLEASIRRWVESGRTCPPMVGWDQTEDGHVVSYVRQLGPVAWDVRMSCPDEGKMRTQDSVTFTCTHGVFDAQELTGMQTWPSIDAEIWPTLDGGRA